MVQTELLCVPIEGVNAPGERLETEHYVAVGVNAANQFAHAAMCSRSRCCGAKGAVEGQQLVFFCPPVVVMYDSCLATRPHLPRLFWMR